MPRLDPRYTRIGPPMHGDWTPDVQGHKTQHPFRHGPRTTWDSRLRGIRDLVGFKTSRDRDFVGFETLRDPGLHGIQDFTGSGTSWESKLHETQQDFAGSRTRQDNRTPTHIGSESCSVVSSYNTNFQDKIKTWTPLGIRLVDSVINCVLFSWLFGARTMPSGLYRAK